MGVNVEGVYLKKGDSGQGCYDEVMSYELYMPFVGVSWSGAN